MNYSKKLAAIALDIGAVKFDPEQPFTWASGYRMPVYNDNRLLLGNADHRMLVAQGLREILDNLNVHAEVVAGTATAGIPHATTLANLLKVPLVYVRPSPKAHGLQNQIEGILNKGQSVILVEDLVSTGGSAIKAVETLRQAESVVNHCLCIFDYGFPEASRAFSKAGCELHCLLNFDILLDCARQSNALNEDQIQLLRAWHKDPFGWGENQGFPALEKKIP